MAEGTTKRAADGSQVAFSEARRAWAGAARNVLERSAQTYNAYLTYEELAELVQEDSGITTGVPFRHWIGQVLGDVARAPRESGEPMLTALVVRADGSIGDGYAGPVTERDGAPPADLELHAAEERLNCYRYFGADLPPDGGKPTLTAGVSKRRSRESKTTARPVCPNCHLALPMSGVCDFCAE